MGMCTDIDTCTAGQCRTSDNYGQTTSGQCVSKFIRTPAHVLVTMATCVTVWIRLNPGITQTCDPLKGVGDGGGVVTHFVHQDIVLAKIMGLSPGRNLHQCL